MILQKSPLRFSRLILGIIFATSLFFGATALLKTSVEAATSEWSLTKQTNIPEINYPFDVEISHDGTTLYVLGRGGHLRAYDSETLVPTSATVNLPACNAGDSYGELVLTPDGKYLLAGDERCYLFFIDPATLSIVHTFNRATHGTILVSDDSSEVVAENPGGRNGGNVDFYTIDSSGVPHFETQVKFTGNPVRLAFNKDQSTVYVAIVNNGAGQNRKVMTIDRATRTISGTINMLGSAIDFAPDADRNILYQSSFTDIEAIDMDTNTVTTFDNVMGYYLDYSKESDTLALNNHNNDELYFYDGATQTKYQTLNLPIVKGSDTSFLSFSPDGNKLYLTHRYDKILYVIGRETTTEVGLDVLPWFCPNIVYTRSRGYLPVAITGDENLDVKDLDRSSLTLNGVVPRWRSFYWDIATPFEPYIGKTSSSDCLGYGRDGKKDLILFFRTKDILETLDDTSDGSEHLLSLEGKTNDGGDIEGEDFIKLWTGCKKSKGKYNRYCKK